MFGMHPDEIEELEYQVHAHGDYMREAFGDSAYCGPDDDDEDEDETQMPGGIAPRHAASVIGQALYALANAWHFHNDPLPF